MRVPRWLQRALLVVLVAGCAIEPLVAQLVSVERGGYLMADFRAFYCGARVTIARQDPYLAAPLLACERESEPQAYFRLLRDVPLPAPLPGYALAMLAPLALLPFPLASIVFGVALLAACAASVVALQFLTHRSWTLPVAALSISLAAVSIPYGQHVPVAVATTCISALLAREQRWTGAALAALVSTVEPHLGVAVCAGLFVWIKQTRLPLLLGSAALAALSVAAIGVHANLEYFTAVLPAHALSGVGMDSQLGLPTALYALGIPAAQSVELGTLSYVLMLAFGVFAAGRLATRYADGALLSCVPVAAVLLGGSFMHVTQIPAAMPAALILASLAWRERHYFTIAALLLSVPWLWGAQPALAFAAAFPVAVMAWSLWSGNVRAVTIAGVVAGALIFGLASWHAGALSHRPAATSTIDVRLPQAAWDAFAHRYAASGSLATFAARLPTWFGLILLCAGIATAVVRTRRWSDQLPRQDRERMRLTRGVRAFERLQ